ncbi:Signal transduction histidine kinase [Streptomyces sp. 2224.1]|uniref:ATP-binding protein n=1 Tax=unclassified Streptomyces TaxID=2593676 RepID=UPI000890A4C8|nr:MULTISPECIES: ATP-binding protein [unclassified Streptomyces]PBC86663.1 signal transduction histidine kinase [Streptomyces sp. 2321.6]SDQ76567.1 Signal transduction histidine kinase [Streptomyces sp. KS_16]SED52439.1 Signal transduction histidine kinase [Streptomyces sp. 2112.3]SED85500.1 Signal transduction histidine kinase [Streptomyces sp. 2224.1]SEE05551.1 Signal transduction histidine kinase [Streptomyces sp. 2133.1]
MTQYFQDPAFWGLIAGTPVAATAIIRGRKKITELRQEQAELKQHYATLESHYAEAVEEAKDRAEEATKTTLKAAMRTLQGLAGEQQLAISKLQEAYGEHKILQDLLDIDHMNSQFARRAQSIAVLCDGWLGRRRHNASLYDVVRSAKGRIRHFTRVEIRSQSNFAIVSRAVEPVALVLAELLDNATSYSAPETMIEINIRPVPKGVCIVVDDAGVGMNEEEKARAARLLSSENAASVSSLGNPPQFGFTVIGVLAARYGFSVSVDSTSPYGGVRAVVLLPEDLLTSPHEPEESPAVAASAPLPPENFPGQQVAGGPAPVPAAPGYPAAGAPYPGAAPMGQQVPAQSAPETTAGGLPKRRRRGAISIVPTDSESTQTPARDSAQTASVMGAFQRGTQSGRRSTNARNEGHEVQ